MNNITGEQIEAAFGFPGLVEFEGRWYESWRIVVPDYNDPVWDRTQNTVAFAMRNCTEPMLVLRTVEVPPKPTQEWLDAHAPEGYTAKCGDRPNKTSADYVGILMKTGEPHSIERNQSCHNHGYDGYRWPVILTEKEAAPEVRYWRSGSIFIKVVDGVMAELIGLEPQDHVGKRFGYNSAYSPTTAAEYEAAKAKATYPGINPQNMPQAEQPRPQTSDLEARVASLEAWRKEQEAKR